MAEEIAMTERAQQIVLASRPVGEPTLDNFRVEEISIPQPGPGQMLLRTRWLSLDPYMRGRMSDAPSYAKPVGIGEAMEGGTVSDVVASDVSGFAKGDPDVAISLSNLASLYEEQSRYADAEPLYRRLLAIQEKALGPDHPDFATSLNNRAGPGNLHRAISGVSA
jgi:NADPH-dependent curcumin reductase CurA